MRSLSLSLCEQLLPYCLLVLQSGTAPSFFDFFLQQLRHDVVEISQFALREDVVHQFPRPDQGQDHHGKQDGDALDGLDEPQEKQTTQLNEGEDVHAPCANVTEIDVVRLIFLGHEDQQDPRDQLDLFHRGDAHVEKDTVENRHGNDPEELRQEDRQTNAEKDDEPRHALLANAEKLRLFSRSCGFRFQFQCNDVVDRENSRRNEPRKTEQRIDQNTNRHDQQIQMITAAFLQ